MDEKEMKALMDKVGAETADAIKSLFAKEKESGVISELDKKLDAVAKVDGKDLKEYLKALQEQTNTLETKMKERKTVDSDIVQQKAEATQWLRAMLKKDTNKMEEIEKKSPTGWPVNIQHAGTNTNIAGGDTTGGFLIPDILHQEVQRIVLMNGVARRDMMYLPFGGAGDQRRIPTIATSITTSWALEGQTKAKSNLVFAEVIQRLNKLALIIILTEEIAEDSAIDLFALCAQIFGEAVAREEDRVFFNGTVPTDPFNGVIRAAGVVPFALAATQRASHLTPDHVLDAITLLPTGVKDGAKIYMHPTLFTQLRRFRADAAVAGDRAGAYLLHTPGQNGKWEMWGHEVVETDVLPAVSGATTANVPFAFIANLKKTCVYGDKQDIRVRVLDQASVYDTASTLINLAERDMLALRMHKRVGYVPTLPGGIVVFRTGAT